MLYSVYHGYIYAVSSDIPATETNDGLMIGKGERSDNLWLCSGMHGTVFPAFISGMSKEEMDEYNYKLTHSELLPECPYAWAVLKASTSYWAGEKKTRLYVAAPDEEEEYLTSVGAVKISGEEKNEAPVSLWYYSSDDPDLPEHFSKYPYIWQDLFTEDDFYYPDDLDEEDDYIEDHEWSEEDSRVSDEYPTYDDSDKYDVANALDDPFEDAETAQDNYDDMIPDL